MKTLELTLKGVCSDISLKGDDEVRLCVNPSAVTSQTALIGIQKVYGSSPNPILTVIGEGYFSVSGVNVKEYEVSSNAYQYVTLNLATMDKNTEISIKNAHNITAYGDVDAGGVVFIKEIEDIIKFRSTMAYLYLSDFDDYLDIDSGILEYFTALQELTLKSKAAFGHLEHVPSTVQKLNISDSNITGNISTLPSNVNVFQPNGSQVYGNLALAPDNFRYIWANESFSWPSATERNASKKQFGISYVNLGNDLDNMLINMAACAANADITAAQKVIIVSGIHTAEEADWQAAVSSLQSAGFTVTIN